MFRTNTAILGGFKIFSSDSCLPFFTKIGSSKRKLVKRNGLILVVSVLAAVGGTGLHHPSSRGVVSLLPPQQAPVKLSTNVAALGSDALASPVALADGHGDASRRPGCLRCPFCCLH